MNKPTRDQVKEARLHASHTQSEAAAELGVSLRTWQAWEGDGSNARNMPASKYELYLIKTGQK